MDVPDSPERATMESERDAVTQAIAKSAAKKRLIVAGPGTGKTYVFQLALRAAGGRGLALTFIRNLVRDLEQVLSAEADAFTLHAYCKYLLHRESDTGLTREFVFYPNLLEIITEDMRLLGRSGLTVAQVTRALQDLDESGGLPAQSLSLAAYYDATSFVDVVFRALDYLGRHPDRTPDYPLIVVDEYQDFTLLETALIAQLATVSRTLIAGDDDQALYSRRFASPAFIRALAVSAEWEKFGLPFCSRCTEVVVAAVRRVIRVATRKGLLGGRLEKDYTCYLPEKGKDSARYPKIVDVRCSVQSSRAPYMARYVAEQVAAIPQEEIEESHAMGFPTVLVIGPKQFLTQVHRDLVERFGYPDAVLRLAVGYVIELLDGYRYLAKDAKSNLGWRILVATDPPNDWGEAVRRAVSGGTPLVHELDPAYRARHLAFAEIVGDLVDGLEISPEATRALEGVLGLALPDVIAAVGRELAQETDAVSLPEDAVAAGHGDEPDSPGPSIVCTSLVGAKGLSAQHVFVVGFNNGHFPIHSSGITDDEVCQLLVALSRTRKQCHLVSCYRFAGIPVQVSVFGSWLAGLVEERLVNAAYWGRT